jgi:DNA-binding XRE family transcriptional regulator
MNISESIKIKRQMNNLTQEQLAKSLKVSKETIVKWEIGTLLPSLQKTIELSQLLNCSIDALVNGINYNSFQRNTLPLLFTYDEPAEYKVH